MDNLDVLWFYLCIKINVLLEISPTQTNILGFQFSSSFILHLNEKSVFVILNFVIFLCSFWQDLLLWVLQ